MGEVASITGESIDHAVRSFQEMVQTATRFQEKSINGLQEMLGAAASPAWRKRAQMAVKDMMVVAQKNRDETLHAMEQNFKTGIELWHRALVGKPGAPPNVQKGTRNFWQTMAGLLRTGTETMTRTNSRIGQTWMDRGGWPPPRKAAGTSRPADPRSHRNAERPTVGLAVILPTANKAGFMREACVEIHEAELATP